MISPKSILFLSAAVLLLHGGCGPSGPELAEVTGTVTVDGTPMPHATVTFIPQSAAAGAGPSSGVTDKSGAFKLGYSRDKTGAWVGQHDVTVRGLEIPDAATLNALKQSGIDPSRLPKVPTKYTNPGELTAEVVSGSNVVDLKLTGG